MSVLFNPDKDNVVEYALSRKYQKKNVHRFPELSVWLKDSQNIGSTVHHNSESSLVFQVKFTTHLDPLWIELNESVLGMFND